MRRRNDIAIGLAWANFRILKWNRRVSFNLHRPLWCRLGAGVRAWERAHYAAFDNGERLTDPIPRGDLVVSSEPLIDPALLLRPAPWLAWRIPLTSAR